MTPTPEAEGIEETHNTREVEEIKSIIADEVLTKDGQVYLSSTGEEKLKQTLHHQLQKAREEWLRGEIESFKKEMQNYPMVNEQEWRNGYTEALEDQINRYQAELDQDKALQDNK